MAINKDDQTDTPQFPVANALQVARLSGTRVHGTTSGTTARVTIPAGATLVRVTAAELCYVNFGGSGVEAAADVTSVLFPAGAEVMPVPLDGSGDPYTHLSFIQHTTGGVIQCEEVA